MKLADKIKYALLRFAPVSGYDIVIPNYYIGMYEADVLKITASGSIWEYEIKISRSDFFADAKKKSGNTTKHEDIQSGKRCNRFYFVVPKGLITLDECPTFAGLILFHKSGMLEVVKAAPIHKCNYYDNYQSLCKSLAFREQMQASRHRKEKAKCKKLEGILSKLKDKYPTDILLQSQNFTR